MIPSSFKYKRANSVDEALSLLGEDTQILGGGHSLIPALKLRLNSPGTLVDISKIDAIKGIADGEQAVTIGGGATHAAIASSELLLKHAPMLVYAAREIGDIQVRNVGTIGGSIAHADPAADWPAVLIAADAKVVIHNRNGRRDVAIDQFFTGFFETALEEGEIITAIQIPKTPANATSAYAKFKQPASRFAIVGCAVAADLDGNTVRNIRIGLTGVAAAAYRATGLENALRGQQLTEGTIDATVNNVTEGQDVMSDHYASEKYRTHLANVYVKRALKKLI